MADLHQTAAGMAIVAEIHESLTPHFISRTPFTIFRQILYYSVPFPWFQYLWTYSEFGL